MEAQWSATGFINLPLIRSHMATSQAPIPMDAPLTIPGVIHEFFLRPGLPEISISTRRMSNLETASGLTRYPRNSGLVRSAVR